MENSIEKIFQEILNPTLTKDYISNENIQFYLNDKLVREIDRKRLNSLIEEGKRVDVLDKRGESAIRLLRKRIKDRISSQKYATKLRCDKEYDNIELELLRIERKDLLNLKIQLFKEIEWYRRELFYSNQC
ncbi:hypothetical protein LOD99_13269 [Oopsacas minuta]|uniref:Uncharacterized protein n=1 Tax=Oopsacas minuta TaxID=111878 RepID=A0AAV7JBE8_9METZ|nr:hypothetical protein LOD99_13269 [Oopsacas minuta]